MENLWSESEAQELNELDKLVYMSRLIGADPSLVVWGGGNTSIKVTEKDFLGRDVEVMRIKGSGSDLKSMERWQFPRLKLEEVLPVFERDGMSDEEMVDYLDRCVLDPNSPRPSIETLLHAFLPFMSVAHSHADAVVGLTNNRDADDILQRVYGDNVAVVEYLRPGFQLSKLVGLAVKESPRLSGVVLVNHGLFTWGDSAKEAYDRHIDLVTKAEEYAVQGQSGASGTVFGGWQRNPLASDRRKEVAAAVAPTLRGLVSEQRRDGAPVRRRAGRAGVYRFHRRATPEQHRPGDPRPPDPHQAQAPVAGGGRPGGYGGNKRATAARYGRVC